MDYIKQGQKNIEYQFNAYKRLKLPLLFFCFFNNNGIERSKACSLCTHTLHKM